MAIIMSYLNSSSAGGGGVNDVKDNTLPVNVTMLDRLSLGASDLDVPEGANTMTTGLSAKRSTSPIAPWPSDHKITSVKVAVVKPRVVGDDRNGRRRETSGACKNENTLSYSDRNREIAKREIHSARRIYINESIESKCLSQPDIEKSKKYKENIPCKPGGRPIPKCHSDPGITTKQSEGQSDRDISVISNVMQDLRICGFFYEDISRQEARELLKPHPTGTFLLRTSTDPRYLFTLSVKTDKGPTSIRIEYDQWTYRLDCEESLKDKMPKFSCVLGLIEFYVKLSMGNGKQQCVWLESSGRKEVPIVLIKPLRKVASSLQHLSRIAINQCINQNRDVSELNLPNQLRTYLREYTFKM